MVLINPGSKKSWPKKYRFIISFINSMCFFIRSWNYKRIIMSLGGLQTMSFHIRYLFIHSLSCFMRTLHWFRTTSCRSVKLSDCFSGIPYSDNCFYLCCYWHKVSTYTFFDLVRCTLCPVIKMGTYNIHPKRVEECTSRNKKDKDNNLENIWDPCSLLL